MGILLILSFLSAAWCASGVPSEGSKVLEPRIVGGGEAPEGGFPYQVSLRRPGPKAAHFAGGSIISKNWVLTAAHCTFGLTPKDIGVVVGTNSLSSGGSRHTVSQIINHENFNTSSLANDIALLQIDGVFHFSERVAMIELADKNTPAGVKCVVTGWGVTQKKGSSPDKLKDLYPKTISVEQCKEALKRPTVTENTVCTYLGKNQGVCSSDSGGPVVDVNTKKQIGIVSWIVPCGAGYPDVHTRVYKYRDWVKDKIDNA